MGSAAQCICVMTTQRVLLFSRAKEGLRLLNSCVHTQSPLAAAHPSWAWHSTHSRECSRVPQISRSPCDGTSDLRFTHHPIHTHDHHRL